MADRLDPPLDQHPTAVRRVERDQPREHRPLAPGELGAAGRPEPTFLAEAELPGLADREVPARRAEAQFEHEVDRERGEPSSEVVRRLVEPGRRIGTRGGRPATDPEHRPETEFAESGRGRPVPRRDLGTHPQSRSQVRGGRAHPSAPGPFRPVRGPGRALLQSRDSSGADETRPARPLPGDRVPTSRPIFEHVSVPGPDDGAGGGNGEG